MFCHKCGTENIDNSKFCSKCGANLEGWNLHEKPTDAKSWEVWKRPGDIVEFFSGFLLIISLFMPFISVTFFGSKTSARLIEGDGKILIVMAIIAILGLFLQGIVVLDFLGALDALFTTALSFYEIYHVEMIIKEKSYGTYDLSGLYNRELGYYLLIAGAVGIVIGLLLRAVIGNSKKKQTTSSHQTISGSNSDIKIPMKKCDICGKDYAYNLDECPACKWKRFRKMFVEKTKGKLPIIISVVIILILVISGLTVYFTKYYLNPEEKNLVNSTIEAINELNSIDLDSKNKIEYAEALYASLSPKCLRYIENGELIQEARNEYNRLCAQNVEQEISAIGEVTLEKKEEIERIQGQYDLLTEEQKSIVSNREILDEAVKELSNIQEAITESEKVVQLFAEGLMNRDTYQIKQTVSEEFMGEDGSDVLDAFVMLYSKDIWAQALADSFFEGQISYMELNYFGRQTLDQLAEIMVGAIQFTRYEMENVRYVDGKVLADVKLYMLQVDSDVDVTNMILDDMKNYVEQNESWLLYTLYGKSDKEMMIEIFDFAAMGCGDKWVRELKKLVNGGRETAQTIHVQVEKIDGDWRITNSE